MEAFYHQILRNRVFGKNKTISMQVAIMIISDKVVSLTTNQNAACVILMILLGPTSSEHTFSAFDIPGSICLLGQLRSSSESEV